MGPRPPLTRAILAVMCISRVAAAGIRRLCAYPLGNERSFAAEKPVLSLAAMAPTQEVVLYTLNNGTTDPT